MGKGRQLGRKEGQTGEKGEGKVEEENVGVAVCALIKLHERGRIG